MRVYVTVVRNPEQLTCHNVSAFLFVYITIYMKVVYIYYQQRSTYCKYGAECVVTIFFFFRGIESYISQYYVSVLVCQERFTVKALCSLITAVNNLSKLYKAMRALRIHKFGGPDTLKLEDIPVPSVGDSEVLVRVHAAGINPVDTYIREGAYATLPKLPAILGREIAGRVEDVGEGVSSVKVFER